MNEYSINRFFYIINYKIKEGWKFQWKSYGPDAWCLTNVSDDSWAKYEVQVTFDTKTLLVYEVTCHEYDSEVSYRWIHPDYVEKGNQEAKEKDVDNSIAYDDVKFTDVSSFEEWESKARDIIDSYEQR